MEYIYRLPVFLAIISGIITGILSVTQGINVQKMAVRVSIAIAISYILGCFAKKALIRLIKESLVRKYLLEEKRRIAKKEKAHKAKNDRGNANKE